MEPTTREEWQEAVDSAKFFLLLNDARLYGLVAGGPDVDVDRCVDILKRGGEQGIVPGPDVVKLGIAELNS